MSPSTMSLSLTFKVALILSVVSAASLEAPPSPVQDMNAVDQRSGSEVPAKPRHRFVSREQLRRLLLDLVVFESFGMRQRPKPLAAIQRRSLSTANIKQYLFKGRHDVRLGK